MAEKFSPRRTLVEILDEPFDSPRHRTLRSDTNTFVTELAAPYWLSILHGHNYFRGSDEKFATALVAHFSQSGAAPGAAVFRDHQTWRAAAILLRDEFEAANEQNRTGAKKVLAVLRTFLAAPGASHQELADACETTTKQIARMTDVVVCQKIWRIANQR